MVVEKIGGCWLAVKLRPPGPSVRALPLSPKPEPLSTARCSTLTPVRSLWLFEGFGKVRMPMAAPEPGATPPIQLAGFDQSPGVSEAALQVKLAASAVLGARPQISVSPEPRVSSTKRMRRAQGRAADRGIDGWPP